MEGLWPTADWFEGRMLSEDEDCGAGGGMAWLAD